MSVITTAPAGKRTHTTPRQKALTTAESLITVEQWAALPEVKPPYELIEGRLVQKMVTTNAHFIAAEEFRMACRLWGRTSGWQFYGEGPAVQINEVNGYIPDVFGYPPDVTLEPDATYNPVPFIAVEVLSLSTAALDRQEKKRKYAELGVVLYLIIDTKAHKVQVYRLEGETYGAPDVLRDNDVWEPTELPGLRVELKYLWFK